ncbi:hypothetical protein HOY82DRAFT_124779 [Tuber indicum]|nr:hypothetical protein HOY82DRAFT_124779 [Tuber indicum]
MAPKTKELQKQCRNAGLDPTGKRAELVQRLNDKLRELKKQCKEAGLDQTGKIPELLQRLKEYRRHRESSTGNLGVLGDTVLLTQSRMGTVEVMMRDERHAFEKAINVEEFETPVVVGKVYVGNPRGLGLASLPERLRILEEESIRIDEMIAAQETEIAAQEARVAELSDYVSLLRQAGPDCQRVRHSLLAAFKRDKLQDPLTAKDREIIEEGNFTEHCVDAAIDAWLYDGPDRRYDTYVFEAIYGLHPSDVRKISCKQTIDLLNLHGQVISHKDKTGTPEFYKWFKVFIKEFKRLDPGVNYLDEGPTNAACAAYWSVWNCQIYVDSM